MNKLIKPTLYCLNEMIKYDVIIQTTIPSVLIQKSFSYNSLNVFPCLYNLTNEKITLFTNHELLSTFKNLFDISKIIISPKTNNTIATDFLTSLSIKLYNNSDYKTTISNYTDLQTQIETNCLNKLYMNFDIFETNKDNLTCLKLVTSIFKQTPERFIYLSQTTTDPYSIPIYNDDSIVLFCSINYKNLYTKTYKILYKLV